MLLRATKLDGWLKKARKSSTLRTMPPIEVGSTLPDATLGVIKDGGPAPVKALEHFKGKKAVLFGVPFAFSPACHEKHVPSYLESYDALKAKGIDTIACFCAVDPFVMRAWGKELKVDDKIEMLGDANRELTKGLGIDLDLGLLGVTNNRCALVVDDGKIKHIAVESAPPNTEVSIASEVLKVLDTLEASDSA